jgi:hypothetical protein
LTEDRAGSSSALYVKQYVKKRFATYRERREQGCTVILARAYIDVLEKLNGDVSETYRLFDKFARTVAKSPVPVRRRGKANRALDARILAAGDAAPRGQREVAVADAAGAKSVKEIDAARRRYNRLRAEKDAREKWLAEVVSAVSPKLRRWPRQELFKNTVPAPLEGPPQRDKYPT